MPIRSFISKGRGGNGNGNGNAKSHFKGRGGNHNGNAQSHSQGKGWQWQLQWVCKIPCFKWRCKVSFLIEGVATAIQSLNLKGRGGNGNGNLKFYLKRRGGNGTGNSNSESHFERKGWQWHLQFNITFLRENVAMAI